MDADKIRKIQALIDNGATEGERAAARQAMKRIKADPNITPLQAVQQTYVTWTTTTRSNTVIQDFSNLFGVFQSADPNHHGRVWFDVT